jgi:hypothetical protein
MALSIAGRDFFAISFAIAYGGTMEITAGTPVWAESALGEQLSRVAATAIVPGFDFPVVWICEHEEWACGPG